MRIEQMFEYDCLISRRTMDLEGVVRWSHFRSLDLTRFSLPLNALVAT